MKPKWLYRLEYKDNSKGLWYNGNGDWCFNEGIGQLDDTCQTKTLPMDYDWRYKQDGKDWFSSCSNKEDLLHWYSIEDAKKLLENGFVFTRYLAIDYHEYENETVFLKETSLSREVINIIDLFNKVENEEMSTEEKIDEIGTHKPINFMSDSDLCAYQQGLRRGAREMAEWKESQLMKDAIEGEIGDIMPLIEVGEMNNYLKYVKAHGLKTGDKVKVILIKEEKK